MPRLIPPPAGPCVEVRRSIDKSIANNTLTLIDFDVELVDTHGQHDTSTLNSQLVCQEPGRYFVHAGGFMGGSAVGRRFCWAQLNGDPTKYQLEAESAATSGGFWGAVLAKEIILPTAGDYLEFGVFQSSGGPLTLYGPATSFISPLYFGWRYLGPEIT